MKRLAREAQLEPAFAYETPPYSVTRVGPARPVKAYGQPGSVQSCPSQRSQQSEIS